jgi:MFS family permease
MANYLDPLRHRDFALLWSGQTVSMLGDGMFTVTLALETLRVDSHPIGLSYVLAARLLPAVVFVLAGGAIVDRVPRRLAMLGSDGVRGLAIAAIAALVASGNISLAALVGMALVFGIADALFYPASTAITPELVPAELLIGASALNNTSAQLAQILIGPAVGGLMVSVVGAAWGFGIDAASFATSAGCLLAMASRPRPTPSGESPGRDIVAGLRYCRSQRWLWVSILAAALGNFVAFSPLGALVPLLVEHTLHQGSLALGLVLAVGGLGGVTATLAVGRRGTPRNRITHLWLGWGLSGLGVLGLGVVPDVWLAAMIAFLTYGLDAYGSVLWNPLLQQEVPPAMIGRVAAVDYFFGFALSPLGLVAAGAAAQTIGVRTTLVIGGAITGLTTLVPLIPGMRDPDRPDGNTQNTPNKKR